MPCTPFHHDDTEKIVHCTVDILKGSFYILYTCVNLVKRNRLETKSLLAGQSFKEANANHWMDLRSLMMKMSVCLSALKSPNAATVPLFSAPKRSFVTSWRTTKLNLPQQTNKNTKKFDLWVHILTAATDNTKWHTATALRQMEIAAFCRSPARPLII